MKVFLRKKLLPFIRSQPPIVIAKGDSAGSHHYWRQEDAHALTQLNMIQGPSVRLPNNHSLSANMGGHIPLSDLLTE